MFNRGKLWIIPNDDIMLPLYFKDISEGVSHLNELQEFSDRFKLGMKFSPDDYQEAPISIAKMGNLVIKSDDDSKVLIFYVPRDVTNRQLEFFLNNEMIFNNEYSKIGGFSIVEDNVEVKRGIVEIRQEIMKKTTYKKKHI